MTEEINSCLTYSFEYLDGACDLAFSVLRSIFSSRGVSNIEDIVFEKIALDLELNVSEIDYVYQRMRNKCWERLSEIGY